MSQQHKPGTPVVGFNHNLSHLGRTFHIQTEDSGPQHAHIITHVFMGGNIFASTKSSYADRLPTLAPGDVFQVVRKLMEEQHKGMMRALVRGQYDAEIERRSGGSVVYEPGVLAGGERAPGLLVGGDKAGETTPAPQKPRSVPTPPPSTLAPPIRSTPAPTIPPPVRPPPAPQTPRAPPPPPAPRPAVATADSSIFGDGLISDRSLDEVILSYLASDLDGPKRSG